jgi:N-acetylglucosaminyl-diphospho-decaprenol L-rhamnosyltransferase
VLNSDVLVTKLVTISVVSHGQIDLIVKLFDDIATYLSLDQLEVILTLNLPETLLFLESDYAFLKMIIRNRNPKGFGANHNQAFAHGAGAFLCVLNPDIRFIADPFPALLASLIDPAIGVVAPLIFSADGQLEDSARKFPTPFKIACKALGGCKGHDYVITEHAIQPDWVGGMFMLLPSKIFAQVVGFDEHYFLYYEDVDLCARLRLLGYEVVLNPQAKVFHYAQRTSHGNFKYFRWHLLSMLRFFVSSVFWRLQFKKGL